MIRYVNPVCEIGSENIILNMDLDDDQRLMLLIGKRDKKAYAALVRKHINKSLAFCERMLGDRHEAEDMAQEAFLQVWRTADRWKPDAKFSTWFHRVLFNLCISYHRKNKLISIAETDEYEDGSGNPEEIIKSAEFSNGVKQALSRLPERQRAAVILFYYQDLSQIQSAEILELSVSAFESLISRARKNLQTSLLESNIGKKEERL